MWFALGLTGLCCARRLQFNNVLWEYKFVICFW